MKSEIIKVQGNIDIHIGSYKDCKYVEITVFGKDYEITKRIEIVEEEQ